MRKRKVGAVGLLLIAAVVVIAVVFLRPKGLAAVLGDGFSPERVTAISAILSPATGGTQTTLEIPAEEEAFGQLLALLQEPSYSRTFAKDDQFTLGYVVYLSFATEETWAWTYHFQGGKLIQAGPTDQTKTYQISGPYQPGYQTYRADPAVQKAIMDLLLAQPYEAIPAT